MKKKSGNLSFRKYFISIGLFILTFSLLSCSMMDWASDAMKFNVRQAHEEDQTWIIGMDAVLYESINDTTYSEVLEPGTRVIKTGDCQQGEIEENAVLCPIKTAYLSKEGWVLETTLVKFEDYLP